MSGPGDRASKMFAKGEPTQSHHADGHAATTDSVDLVAAVPPGSETSASSHMPFAREPGDLGGASSESTGRQPREGISPLLSTIYLHYVLDLRAQRWRRRDARGEVDIVRYADDFVMSFEDGRDARSMRAALAKRLGSFGLELHPDCGANKTLRASLPSSQAPRRSPLAGAAFRFAVDRRWEPGARNLHAGFCPGGGPKGPSLPAPSTSGSGSGSEIETAADLRPGLDRQRRRRRGCSQRSAPRLSGGEGPGDGDGPRAVSEPGTLEPFVPGLPWFSP